MPCIILPKWPENKWPDDINEIQEEVQYLVDNKSEKANLEMIIRGSEFINKFMKHYGVNDPSKFHDADLGISMTLCERLLDEIVAIHIVTDVGDFTDLQSFMETLYGIYPFKHSYEFTISAYTDK